MSINVGTLNDQALEDAAVAQVAVDVAVTVSSASSAEVDVVDRVERAGDGDGATVGAAAAAAVGAGGRGRPPVPVVHGQLAARRRVERLELGAAREVEGAPGVAGLTAAAATAEVGQVLFE